MPCALYAYTRHVLPGEAVLPVPVSGAAGAAAVLIADCASLQHEADPLHCAVARLQPGVPAGRGQHQVAGRGAGGRLPALHPDLRQEAVRGDPW